MVNILWGNLQEFHVLESTLTVWTTAARTCELLLIQAEDSKGDAMPHHERVTSRKTPELTGVRDSLLA